MHWATAYHIKNVVIRQQMSEYTLTKLLITIIFYLFKDAGSLLSATRDAVLKALVTYLGEDADMLYYTLEVINIFFSLAYACVQDEQILIKVCLCGQRVILLSVIVRLHLTCTNSIYYWKWKCLRKLFSSVSSFQTVRGVLWTLIQVLHLLLGSSSTSIKQWWWSSLCIYFNWWMIIWVIL